MRIITEKDKRGLLIAVRTMMRTLNGERIPPTVGAALIDAVLAAGVTFDELLNPGNYARACEARPGCDFAAYAEALTSGAIEVKALKDEPGWHEVAGSFALVAEAAHDFFQEVSERGGKWNVPTALTALAKAVRAHSLQAILSEVLIDAVCGTGEDALNYFNYIQAIAKDFNSLPIDDTPTEATVARLRDASLRAAAPAAPSAEEMAEIAEEVESEHDLPPLGVLDEDPDLVPYPDPVEGASGFQTEVLMQSNPRQFKRDCLAVALGGYNPTELLGLVRTIEGGEKLTMSEIIDRLTDGKFDVSLESPETRQIHMEINGDLKQSFIDCLKLHGIEMDEETADKYDILHGSWEFRNPEVRKLNKLKELIYSYGGDDPDLLAAIPELERLYSAD